MLFAVKRTAWGSGCVVTGVAVMLPARQCNAAKRLKQLAKRGV